MSVANFIPQVWVAPLVQALRKKLVYAGPQIVNRDYEGEISEAGDTVKVTSIGRPTIKNYVPNETVVTPEKPNTSQRTMVIDQSKHWSVAVDDVDKRQVKGDLIKPFMSEAAYGLADVVDQYIANKYTEIPAASVLPDVTFTGTDQEAWGKLAYFTLVDLQVLMDERNIPTEGRYAACPPWYRGLIQKNPNFTRVSEYGSGRVLLNGEIGEIAGFSIVISNNNPKPVPTSNFIQAGVNGAISFAEQLNQVEAYRPESSFADAVKGLAVYGGKVMRPDLLAGVEVTRPGS
ncbi:P22 phage major capsid protein family protein [Amycolatopsis sp. BJA-103]|uniref:P22 phage major capsid protein family protein n=1 Tax=Amycolatopsis sp. BJA-103 TaxID=1911175 RepID=UPI000C76F143|nr:P22 phage major capsid protein family protein [Amycolatopsis sp. BJA-103]AUI56790.1 P22 coat protein - protein 5 domain protein [Amycolatopsis sp. BJA-103]PNE13111.1 P22 coat protein - protein 5 domain protein [Amycolatopsis sp. BJA-103]